MSVNIGVASEATFCEKLLSSMAGATHSDPESGWLLRSNASDRSRVIQPCGDGTALDTLSSNFVRSQYWAVHRACLGELMPERFAILDGTGNPEGVVGIRRFGDGQTLVERYLDGSAEHVVSEALGTHVDRRLIVEVGNLAATGLAPSCLLIIFLFHYLKRQNITHALCTGTHAVRLALKRAGVPFTIIGDAEPARLGADLAQWGSYYENSPQVMSIAIGEGLPVIQQRFPFCEPISPGVVQ